MAFKVLIIDDDIDLCYALKSYLINKGLSVFAVHNLKDAVKVLNYEYLDLIVSDIMLPNVDGYKLVEILKSMKLFNQLPFIFLTAKGLTKDKIHGYDIGCSAYLSKPFNPDELLSIINNLLNYSEKQYDLHQFIDLSKKNLNFIEFSVKEQIIVNLATQGFMNKELGNYLNINIRNIEKYVSKLLSKTKTNNRTELLIFILQNYLST
uniref:Regulatory component of sensory transduction system n=1 Tax=Cyanidium sp. THAL103 TaxID=3027999 RepID=A0A9Y1MY38_9RHOD|nr:regulatory component of sensory transduction system [Cyanidium sp. THAL103]